MASSHRGMRLAGLLLGAAVLQWRPTSFLITRPSGPRSARTARRSLESLESPESLESLESMEEEGPMGPMMPVEAAEAPAEVPENEMLYVGAETPKFKLAGAIKSRLQSSGEVTMRFAGMRCMQTALSAVIRANRYVVKDRREAGETELSRLIVRPTFTVDTRRDGEPFTVMNFQVQELKGPMASKLHADEEEGTSDLEVYPVGGESNARKLAGAVKGKLDESGMLRIELIGAPSLRIALTSLTQVAGMNEQEGAPEVWFHPFWKELSTDYRKKFATVLDTFVLSE